MNITITDWLAMFWLGLFIVAALLLIATSLYERGYKKAKNEYFESVATQDAYNQGRLSLWEAKCCRWHNNAFNFHFKKGEES